MIVARSNLHHRRQENQRPAAEASSAVAVVREWMHLRGRIHTRLQICETSGRRCSRRYHPYLESAQRTEWMSRTILKSLMLTLLPVLQASLQTVVADLVFVAGAEHAVAAVVCAVEAVVRGVAAVE